MKNQLRKIKQNAIIYMFYKLRYYQLTLLRNNNQLTFMIINEVQEKILLPRTGEMRAEIIKLCYSKTAR